MKHVVEFFASEERFLANLGVAVVAWVTTLHLEDGAKIFAAMATGLWFLTQTVLAILTYRRKRAGRAKEVPTYSLKNRRRNDGE